MGAGSTYRTRMWWTVALIGFACVPALQAQQLSGGSTAPTPVPRVVWFSGAFHPADGLPIAPVETVTLAVYHEEQGGDPLWQESHNVVVDAVGRYSVLMGSASTDGVPPNLFTTGEPRWLGVRFSRAGEREQPRVPLASVPYALKAADADTLGGKPASAYLLATRPAVGVTAPTGKVTATTVVGDATTLANTGTAGRIGVFVDAANLGNSEMTQFGTGPFSRIGLGTTSPQDYFHVSFDDQFGAFTGLAVQNRNGSGNASSGMLFFDQNGALAQFQGFSNLTHEYRINNIALNGSINFLTGNISRFAVASNGNVGIGTSTPTRAKLEISGTFGTFTTGPGQVYAGSGATGLGAGTYAGESLYASDGIISSAFIALSDERIKRVAGRSDASRDLATLARIEVTDYSFIDTVTKGSGKQKKVIAQQVELVYPQAVSRRTDVVPDLYQKAWSKDGWVMLATTLHVGERVRLIGKQTEGVHEVLEIAEGKFRTAFAADGEEVFVYGREVKDFRSVDYDAIAMLNVSATQELNRRLEQQAADFAALAAQMRTQTARTTELEQERQSQATRIAELEKQASEIGMLRRQMADLQAAVRMAGRLDSTRVITAK